jgi:hypothetical protein
LFFDEVEHIGRFAVLVLCLEEVELLHL